MYKMPKLLLSLPVLQSIVWHRQKISLFLFYSAWDIRLLPTDTVLDEEHYKILACDGTVTRKAPHARLSCYSTVCYFLLLTFKNMSVKMLSSAKYEKSVSYFWRSILTAWYFEFPSCLLFVVFTMCVLVWLVEFHAYQAHISLLSLSLLFLTRHSDLTRSSIVPLFLFWACWCEQYVFVCMHYNNLCPL